MSAIYYIVLRSKKKKKRTNKENKKNETIYAGHLNVTNFATEGGSVGRWSEVKCGVSVCVQAHALLCQAVPMCTDSCQPPQPSPVSHRHWPGAPTRLHDEHNISLRTPP